MMIHFLNEDRPTHRRCYLAELLFELPPEQPGSLGQHGPGRVERIAERLSLRYAHFVVGIFRAQDRYQRASINKNSIRTHARRSHPCI